MLRYFVVICNNNSDFLSRCAAVRYTMSIELYTCNGSYHIRTLAHTLKSTVYYSTMPSFYLGFFSLFFFQLYNYSTTMNSVCFREMCFCVFVSLSLSSFCFIFGYQILVVYNATHAQPNTHYFYSFSNRTFKKKETKNKK